MADLPTCPECGRPLPEGVLEGFCPVCSLQSALSVSAAAESQTPTSTAPKGSARGSQALPRFADYEPIELLARGGMGVVYKARQVSLNRTVALKMIQAGVLATPAEVKRFQAEAEAIARLQHPNIVAVHEIGQHDGQHFFSMDYVAGRTLAEIVRDGPLPATRAAIYVKAIATAVHYAHQQGILHRDLKPANVIIDESDQPRITDFGLAKRLSDSQLPTLNAQLTLTGQVLGSPNYLPPEQAEPKWGPLGPPSDVYALGAILYHLVTGRPPFQAESLTTLLRQVIETDPVAPRSLNPGIPRDLETICLKCLEKEPHRRYDSAQALADDLGRFLNHEPVLARPIGVSGRAVRWCQRQPIRAGLLTALFVVFVAGAAGVLWQWRQASTQRRAAVAAGVEAQIGEYAASIALAQSLIQTRQFAQARESLLKRAGESYRGWEWGWLLRNCNQDLMTLSGRASLGVLAYFSPDSRLLVTAGFADFISIWDLSSGNALTNFPGFGGAAAMTPFSPDGKRLCVYNWSAGNRTARVWDVEQRRTLFEIPNPATTFATLSCDGRRMAICGADGTVRVYDAMTGSDTGLSNRYGDAVTAVVFSPDGRRIAYAGGEWYWAGSQDATVRVWDLASGDTKRLIGHEKSVYGLAWSPDGTLLVSCGMDGKLKAWDPDSGRESARFEASPKQRVMFRADFSPNGEFLAVVGMDDPNPTARVTIFDVRTRRVVHEYGGHSAAVQGIRFSPDGKSIVTSGFDGTVKLWRVPPLPEFLSLEGHSQPVWTAVFSPDGRLVATASLDQTARVWDAETGVLLRTLMIRFPVISLAFSPDGKRIVTPGPENTACIWNVEGSDSATDGEQFRLRGHTRAVMSVAWSPDGHLIATGGKDNKARIWDAAMGTERLTLAGHSNIIHAVAFSPDGELLATGSADGTARLWSTSSGQGLRILTNHNGPVLSLAFSPNRRWLATGSMDGTALIWETGTGQQVHLVSAQMNGVSSVAFSPDSQRLVTASGGINLHAVADRTPKIFFWDVASGHQLFSLFVGGNMISGAAFDSTGRRLVTSSCDNTARIWTAFPWHSADYPGETNATLASRVEQFKRQFWKQAIAAQTNADAQVRPWTNGFDLYLHTFGYMNLPPAGSKTQPLFPIPPRSALAGSKQVDLGGVYNVALNESWQPIGNLADVDRSLETFTAGLRNIDGVSFDIRGIVQLRGVAPDSRLYPERITIPVGKVFRRFHVLHGATWSEPQGRQIGAYILHYADGKLTEVPILFGEHLRGEDARTDPEAKCTSGKLVWGTGAVSDQGSNNPRVYQTVFANPTPTVQVERIEFTSKLTKCGPFLLALTLE